MAKTQQIISRLAAATLGLCPSVALAQATIFVDDNGPNDPGPFNPNVSDPNEDGSFANPFDKINEAIDASTSGDTIVVRAGTYFDTVALDTDGKAITITSESGADVTFIEGFAVSGPIFVIDSGEGRDTVIEGLTIQGGNAVNAGAMDVVGASPTLRDLVFRNNTAGNDAGALYLRSGSQALVDGCLFEDNLSTDQDAAGIDGGAIFVLSSSPTVIDSVFRGNEARQGSAIGIFGSVSNIDIINCLFEDNLTRVDGAVHVDAGANVRIRLSTFRRNSANGGAAVFSNASTVLVDRCEFLGNFLNAAGGGGAVLLDSTTFTATNSIFVGNTSPNDGGAVFLRDNTNAFFENCAVTANDAGDAVGGIFTPNDSVVTLLNCIVAGNTDQRPTSFPNLGGTAAAAAYVASWSILDTAGLPTGAALGPELFSATPSQLFTRLPSPGPDAVWGTADDDYGDLSLVPTAPAIDAGSSVDYTGPLADFAGADRAQDDPDTTDTGFAIATPTIDLGAFEFNIVSDDPVDTCPADIDGDELIDLDDLLTVLGQFGDPCP